MNFIITSFLCDPKKQITNLVQLEKDPNHYLIAIDDLKRLKKIKGEIDKDYIEGVIYLQYGTHIIFNYNTWDLIDQLWAYIINTIQEYIATGKASSYFPDQPIKFEMEKGSNDLLLFRVFIHQQEEWMLPEKAFLNTLLDGASYFFYRLHEELLIEPVQYSYEMDRIEKIKNIHNAP